MEEIKCCPLCGGSSRTELTRSGKNFQGEAANVCTACGLVYLSPRLSPQELTRFYANEYSALYRGSVVPTPEIIATRQGPATERAAALERLLPNKGARVLEIGCSLGLFLDELRMRGYENVSGIDFSSGYTEWARRVRGLKVFTGGFPDALPDRRPFDAIALFQTFEHMSDPNQTLEQIRSLLAPDGLLTIEVPDLRKKAETGWLFPNYFENVHIFDYCLSSLGSMCRKHGFQLLQHQYGQSPRKYHHLRIVARKLGQPAGNDDFDSSEAARLTELLQRRLRFVFPKRVIRFGQRKLRLLQE